MPTQRDPSGVHFCVHTGVHLRTANLADAYLEGQRLTERDRWLIGLLAEHRVLTVDQITALAFAHVRRARRRLRLLVQRGVLARFRRPTPTGSQPWRYTLGILGEHIHAAHTGAPLPRPAKVSEKITRLAESRNLEHLLGVNGFFVALAAHARTHPDTELSLWWSERRTAEATKDHVRPDGFGAWTEHHTGQPVQVRFFVEYDRGQEQHDQLIDKLTRYAAMTRADVDRPILFVFTTTTRETNFTHHANAAGWPRHLTIATTATDQHTPTQPPATNPAHPASGPVLSPAGRVWLPLGATHRRRLIELAHHSGPPTSPTQQPPHPPNPHLPAAPHPPAPHPAAADRPPHTAA